MDEAFGYYVNSLYSGALPHTEHIKALNAAIAEGNTIINRFMSISPTCSMRILSVD